METPGAGPQIVQYWHSGDVPSDVAALCESFRTQNPTLDYRLYSHADAERLIVAHCGQREVEAFRSCAVPAMQADYFRYCAILAHGGIYADADFRCIAPLAPWLSGIDGGEFFFSPTPASVAGRDARRVWNGFFAFAGPDHPFLRLALEIATVNVEERLAERLWPGQRVGDGIWLAVGSGVLTFMQVLHDWGSFDAVIESFAGTPVEPFIELNCRVIDDYTRIERAFKGVRIAPHEEMLHLVEEPKHPPLYKDTESDWRNAKVAFKLPG